MDTLALMLLGGLLASGLLLGAHALRHRCGLAPFLGVLCAYTALVSLTVNTELYLQSPGFIYQVGPLVFLSAILAGLLALYACDGPKAMCRALVIVGLVGLLMPAAFVCLAAVGGLAGAQWTQFMEVKNLRLLPAGVLASFCSLLALAMTWEFFRQHGKRLPLALRIFITLFGVMLLDTVLFNWWAYAGSGKFGPSLQGGLLCRGILAVVYTPVLWFYLRAQQNPYEISLGNRTVFALWKEISKLCSQLLADKDEVKQRSWAHKEMQHNEDRLALAIEASGAGVFGMSEPHDAGVFVDRAWAALLGYSLSELPPKEEIFDWWMDCMHPDDRERVERSYNIFINGLIPENRVEYRMRTKQGDYIHLLSVAKAMERDLQGRVTSLAGTITDVTERRAWEETLQASRRHMSQIIDSLPDAILVIDSKGKVTAWNRAMEKLTGVAASQILGKGDYEYAVPFYGYRRPMLADIVLDPELSEELDQVFLHKEAMGGISAETFHPKLGPEGAYLWGMARPLYDSEGKETGAIQSIRDVTQRRNEQLYQEDLISRLQAAQENLRRLSLLDSLTGLANRRHFEQAIQLEVRRATREEMPLGLVMCDLDYFKNYNDTYGHQAGDVCLRKVGQAIKESLNRPGDLAARYGGEEFVVLLPNTGPKGSMLVAKAMQAAVAALQIPHVSSKISDHLTISLGVANTEYGIALDDQLLVAAADQGLYLAKDRGRNRIVEAMPPIQARLKQIR